MYVLHKDANKALKRKCSSMCLMLIPVSLAYSNKYLAVLGVIVQSEVVSEREVVNLICLDPVK